MPTPATYTPYCGLLYRAGNPYMAESAPHLAISAPTRTGKTRRILAPAAVVHPGPAVCVSSKEDLAELVLTRRFTGPTGVIDLRPQKTLVWPANVRRMVTDPTAAITSADEALTVPARTERLRTRLSTALRRGPIQAPSITENLAHLGYQTVQ